jgi:hypothetical protein
VGFLTVPPFSLLGVGIGMGIDAAHPGDPETYLYTFKYSETDTIRIGFEAGTLTGLVYNGVRILFSAGMILLAMNVVRRGGPPHVLPLAFVMFLQSYQGDLTRLGTVTFCQVALAYSFILGADFWSRGSMEWRPNERLNQTRFA